MRSKTFADALMWCSIDWDLASKEFLPLAKTVVFMASYGDPTESFITVRYRMSSKHTSWSCYALVFNEKKTQAIKITEKLKPVCFEKQTETTMHAINWFLCIKQSFDLIEVTFFEREKNQSHSAETMELNSLLAIVSDQQKSHEPSAERFHRSERYSLSCLYFA